MHASILLAGALSASLIAAAPTWPQLNQGAIDTDGAETISEYFNLLASKVEAGQNMGVAPTCDLTRAELPQSPEPLEPPSEGLILKHVAIGRGTQNYTCDLSNSTAVPVAAGAVATLFNASCVASSYPDLLHLLPGLSMRFDVPYPYTPSEAPPHMGPSDLAVSGNHYFTDLKTPFFDLLGLGNIGCAKHSSVNAPGSAPAGAGGEKAVPWLKLSAKEGATGDLREVYRVETAGGSAPATCQGQAASFTVQYAAQYWFFEGPAPAA
jgi:hypothetical protein